MLFYLPFIFKCITFESISRAYCLKHSTHQRRLCQKYFLLKKIFFFVVLSVVCTLIQFNDRFIQIYQRKSNSTYLSQRVSQSL